MCWTGSGGDCLFGHGDSVIGACPGDPSLCFPNTSPVSATQTGSPQGPGCSLSTTLGLLAPSTRASLDKVLPSLLFKLSSSLVTLHWK